MVIKSWSPANLQSELNKLRVESNHTDLTFLCQDIKSNETVKINAHKVLFSTLSPFLKELFMAQQLEQPYENITVTLDSFDSNVVKKLVVYIYEGEILVDAIEKSQLQGLCGIMKLQLPLSYDSNEGYPVSIISKGTNGNGGKIKKAEDPLNVAAMQISSEEMQDIPNEKCFISSTIITRSGKRKRHESVPNESAEKSMDKFRPCINDPSAIPKSANVKNELVPLSPGKSEQHCVYVDILSNVIVKSPNSEVCPTCAFETGNRRVLTRHMRINHDMHKRYQCIECGVMTTTAPALRLHVDSQHIGIRYQCSECHFSSNNPYNLERHKNVIHENIRSHQCYLCPYVAGQKKQLGYHMQTHHPIAGFTF